uniref:GAF domain-containing protein n=1 Tax=Chloroflexus sp. TaxID=1904827 RepID=UPI002ACE3DDF
MKELIAIIGLAFHDQQLAIRKLRAWVGQDRGALTWVWLLRFGGLICLAIWTWSRVDELSPAQIQIGGSAIIALFFFQIITAIGGFKQPKEWQFQRNKLYQNIIEVLLLSLAIIHLGPAHGVFWSFYLIPILSAVRFLRHLYSFLSIFLTIVIASLTGWLAYNYSITGIFIPLTVNLVGWSILFVARRIDLSTDALADRRSELAQILEHYRSGICVIDRNQRLRFVNAELRRHFGEWTNGIRCYQYLGCANENCSACMLPAGTAQGGFRQTMIDHSGRKHEFEVTAQHLSEEGDVLMFLDYPRTIRLDLYERLLDTIVEQDEASFTHALKQLLDWIREQFRAETAAIFWVSSDDRIERAVDSGPELNFAEYYAPGQGVTGFTIVTKPNSRFGQIVRVNNLDEHEAVRPEYVAKYQQALPSGKVRHLLAVPINGRQKTIGVLRLVNHFNAQHELDQHGFHSAHAFDLQMIAERLARALEYREWSQAQAQQLAEVKRFYRMYAASAGGQDVFRTIVTEALAAFPEASKCEIRRLNRANRTLEYVTASHRRGFDHGIAANPITGINARALQTRTIEFVQDTGKDADFTQGNVPIGAIVVAPLVGQLGVSGVLTLDYLEPRTFADKEKERVRAFATHAALVAEAFWRKEQAERLRDHIQRIAEDISRGLDSVYHNLLNALRDLIGYDSASIQLRYGDQLKIVAHTGFANPEIVELISFDLNEQRLPNYHVMKWCEPLIVADVRQDYPHFELDAERYQSAHIRSILYTPIIYRRQAIGMIALDSHTENFYQFSDSITSTLLASAAASAIENARLVVALAQQQAKLRHLLKSSTELIGIDSEERLRTAYAHLGKQLFACEHCAIFMYSQSAGQFELGGSSLAAELQLPRAYNAIAEDIAARGQIVRLAGEELIAYYDRYGLSAGTLDHGNSSRCRSVLAGPVRDEDQTIIGIVMLEYSSSDDSGFAETTGELMELFGRQLAYSLGIVNLRRSTRESLGIDVHDLVNFLQGTVIFTTNTL